MIKIFFILAVFTVLNGNAQNYLISFESSVPVDRVIVENVTTGDSLTLAGHEVLNLKGTSGTTGIRDNRTASGLKIYPNPMVYSSKVEVLPPKAGEAIISVYDISGNQIASIQTYLADYKQEFVLRGESKGLYIISVRGNDYQLSGKVLCTGNTKGNLSIEKVTTNQVIDAKATKNTKGTEVIIEMYYYPGNRIKFTAISGDMRTIISDIPDQDKTITFELEKVEDADNNNYHLVVIGDQKWLEENLKTTKYDDLEPIPYSWPLDEITGWDAPTVPGYVWYNDSIKYKEPYGALYNYLTASNSNLCPAGYHVPTMAEWTSFKDHLSMIYNYYTELGKSIASTSRWTVSTPFVYKWPDQLIPVAEGSIGLDQSTNNSTGFNAYSAGSRHPHGHFTYLGSVIWWWGIQGVASIHRGDHTEGSYLNISIDNPSGQGNSVRCVKN